MPHDSLLVGDIALSLILGRLSSLRYLAQGFFNHFLKMKSSSYTRILEDVVDGDEIKNKTDFPWYVWW